MANNYVRWFNEIRSSDVALVGGKNSALGELYTALAADGVPVPDGCALTVHAYRDALTQADAWKHLATLLEGLGKSGVEQLAKHAAQARKIVYDATGIEALRTQVAAVYDQLRLKHGADISLAVRSSATAEDLPTASFAGQHDSFLNVRSADDLFEACRRCFASVFTDRAIVYRNDNGFDHLKVGLSVGIMRMVRSDLASSGVVFTLDTDSGFPDVVFVTASYGLGESVVQGRVDPDEFHVLKPTFRAGHRCVLRRALGRKQSRMVYADGEGPSGTRTFDTSVSERDRFCIDDADVLKLASYAIQIEDHFSKHAGHPVPMDIEWAKDGPDGELYIVQARPETVASRRAKASFEVQKLKGTGPVLAVGRAVGERIATGRVRAIGGPKDLAQFNPGEVLVAETTSPDWEPVMKGAAAIVTDRGGRTCHAAIVARELGVPAIVGTQDATARLKPGELVTVSCAEGETGSVLEGAVPFETATVEFADIARPRTAVMVNLGNPDLAFRTAMRPNDGVGLARMEFIISEQIGIHPMAVVHPEKVRSVEDRESIARRARLHAGPVEFFVNTLSEGIGTIAAAFYPKPVIVRLSDFKTNEYARLLGGRDFEPVEENPMLGFRGAARYAHPAYAAGFALECAALRRVRNDMGLMNVCIMVPFCRRVVEARQVLSAMADHGLRRGERGLQVYVMCEIPNNVIQIDAFAELFDGFSIGSNDLTQLTLGVDRDSQIVAFDFDERDPGMLAMLRMAVEGARRNHRHVGICGEAPANYPEIAAFLTRLGIDSISVNPGSVLRTLTIVAEAEQAVELERQARPPGHGT